MPPILKPVMMKSAVGNAAYGGGLPIGEKGGLTSTKATVSVQSPKDLAGKQEQAIKLAKARAEELKINKIMRDDEGVGVRFAEGINSATGKALNYDFMAGMAVIPVLGWLTGAFEKIGNISYIGAPFRGLSKAIGFAGDVVSTPINFANNHTLNETAVGLAQGVDNVTNKVTSNETITNATASFVESAEKNIPSIQNNISKGYDTAIEPIAWLGDKAEQPLSFFAKRTLNKINSDHIPNAQNAVKSVQEELAKHVGELGNHAGATPHIESLETALNGLHQHLHADELPTAKVVKEHLADFHSAMGELGKLKDKSDNFKGALKKVSDVLEDKKTSKGFFNKIKGFFADTPTTQLDKAVKSFENYNLLSKPGEAVRASGKILANTDMHTLGMNAAFSAGMVAQSAHTVHDLNSQVKDLVQLAAALEGKKSVSALHVFTSSDVPKPIKEARSQILHSFSPRLVTEAIAAVFNIKMMRGGMGMAAMAGLMAPSLVNSVLQPKNQLLPVLHQMNLMTKIGQPLDRDMYAQLLTAGSEEVAKNGGVDNLLTRSVAEAYAAEQISPTDVLKEIDSGKMNARATEIQTKLRENGHKAGEKVPESIAAHNAELAEKAKIYGADKVDKPIEIQKVAEPNTPSANKSHHAENIAELPVIPKPKQDKPTNNISNVAMAEPLINHQVALG